MIRRLSGWSHTLPNGLTINFSVNRIERDTPAKPLLNEDGRKLANTENLPVFHSTDVAQEAQRNHA